MSLCKQAEVRNWRDIREERAQALYREDRNTFIRKSHNNPASKHLYKEYPGQPTVPERSNYCTRTIMRGPITDNLHSRLQAFIMPLRRRTAAAAFFSHFLSLLFLLL